MTFSEGDAEVYRRYAADLTRYASMLVGHHDAPDVVATAVLSAMSARGWHAVENPRAYLYRAVFHAALRWRRRAVLRLMAEDRAARRSPEFGLDERPEVVDALRRLSVQQRAVVFLTYWEDLTPRSCAELLDVSEGTVKRYLARARLRLREVLDEHG
jgi:RNA polymerase sigma-70 factor (ECF subfamily)